MHQMLSSAFAHRDILSNHLPPPSHPPMPSNSAMAMLACLQLVQSFGGQDKSQSEWTERDSVS